MKLVIAAYRDRCVCGQCMAEVFTLTANRVRILFISVLYPSGFVREQRSDERLPAVGLVKPEYPSAVTAKLAP